MSAAGPRWPNRKSGRPRADAINEVRASAVDLAVAAAENLIGKKVDGEAADALVQGFAE
jgi:F-type H+-transporting ATPase subunit b